MGVVVDSSIKLLYYYALVPVAKWPDSIYRAYYWDMDEQDSLYSDAQYRQALIDGILRHVKR